MLSVLVCSSLFLNLGLRPTFRNTWSIYNLSGFVNMYRCLLGYAYDVKKALHLEPANLSWMEKAMAQQGVMAPNMHHLWTEGLTKRLYLRLSSVSYTTTSLAARRM